MENLILNVEHLMMRFSGLLAINDISLQAKRQEISSIIGPNGAGKTTLFNCLTGFYKPTSGRLTLTHSGKTFFLERMDTYKIPQTAKIARTFQNIRLFPAMTLLENLLVAQHNWLMDKSGYTIKGLLGLSSYKQAEKEAIEFACHWLERVGLIDYANVAASGLPYGDQRRLEIARAMCTKPQLLCLDEPAAGLNHKESADLNQLILSIKDKDKIAILLIEHDMNVVMEISDHVIVIDYGKKIAEGSPQVVKNDPVVIKAYLGEEFE